MSEPTDEVNTWDQLQLFPSAVYEATLKIGLVPESDHLQIQLSWQDPSTGALLALQSVMHVSAQDCSTVLDSFFNRLRSDITNLSCPFPDPLQIL